MKINEILYESNEKRSRSIETIASMSHMLAPDFVGAKEVLIFLNYEVPPIICEKIYIVTLNVSML